MLTSNVYAHFTFSFYTVHCVAGFRSYRLLQTAMCSPSARDPFTKTKQESLHSLHFVISHPLPASNHHASSPLPIYKMNSVVDFCSSVLTHSAHLLAFCTQTGHQKQEKKHHRSRIPWSSSHCHHKAFIDDHPFLSTACIVWHTSVAP